MPGFRFFFLHVHFIVKGSQFVSLTSMENWVRETKGWQGVTLYHTRGIVDHFVFPSFLLTSNLYVNHWITHRKALVLVVLG